MAGEGLGESVGAKESAEGGVEIGSRGLGNYNRNQGCKIGSITYEYEIKMPNYDPSFLMRVGHS